MTENRQYPPPPSVSPYMHIKQYTPARFTATFMPSRELSAQFRGDTSQFFILPLETMYQHVHAAVPPSKGTSHSCLLLTEGSASMQVGGGHYTIHPGDILFVPAGQVFSFPHGETNKGYILNFHDDFLQGKYGNADLAPTLPFLRGWAPPCIHLDVQTYQFVLHIFERMWQAYAAHGIQQPDILQPYLVAMLCEVNRAGANTQAHTISAAHQLAQRFTALLFDNISRTHAVADYAALLHVSPGHLHKAVRNATGKPPTRWIDEAILLQAKALLRQSDAPVAEVATAVGLQDPSYFTRLFKKYEGITPGAFRRQVSASTEIS